jgi:hypothetical protein
LAFEVEHSYDTTTILVDTLFLIILTLVDVLDELSGAMLQSPDLRYEVKNFKTYAEDYGFCKEMTSTRFRSWKQSFQTRRRK